MLSVKNSLKAFQEKYPEKSALVALPFMLSFGGNPFTTLNHFYTEPFYNIKDIAPTTTFMTGRQVGKTLGLGAQSVQRSWLHKYWHLLVFTPLFSQVSYLSDTYFKPLIEDSPMYGKFVDKRCKQNNLFRQFTNGSSQIFTYAYTNPDRIRGKSVDAVTGDEMQDFNPDFLPIIEACMDAREHVGVRQFTGTPKTLDNTLTVLYDEGSQAGWCIKCPACGHENMCNDADMLLKMIGKEGPICAKCGKPINPAEGRYVHTVPERRLHYRSYHIPQVICPIHYKIREKWDKLVHKMENQEKHIFFNEVLGLPCDTGQKLVSLTDLKTACKIQHSNHIDTAKSLISSGRYKMTALGVDWSGGGKEYQSFTSIAVAGLTHANRIEIPFMKKMPYTTNHMEEATIINSIASHLSTNIIAHDFSGAGNVRETCMVHSGMPSERIMPITLSSMPSYKGLLKFATDDTGDTRRSYTLDKGRGLVFTCSLIKSLGIVFPKYESCKDELGDFLNLIEHYIERPQGGPVYGITKVPKKPDDTAFAVMFAAIACFYATDAWPNLSNLFLDKYAGEDDNFSYSDRAADIIKNLYAEPK